MVDKSISQLLDRLISGHSTFISNAKKARAYYNNRNDIKREGVLQYSAQDASETNPLKLADNRISHNWHSLLVNQKAGYTFTYPPIFDVGNTNANKIIKKVLGDKFPKITKSLAIDASNCTVGWLHYWEGKDREFKYAVVDPEQIIPVYTNELEAEISGILRAYMYINEKGEQKSRCEFWDAKEVKFYEKDDTGTYTPFYYPGCGEVMPHNMGAVPFIPFYNNENRLPDLDMYKDLIDAYDKVYSGFNNDIDDVQQVIFVIKNYDGEDKVEFIKDLRKTKTIKVDDDGGVDTIRAEIPCEARNTFLDRTRKQIFTSGMGVDPDIEKIGNTSGEALKFMYSLLELKAGLLETEFRIGFSELIRAICRFKNIDVDEIEQTWTRNMIKNELENSQIASNSKDIISDESILKNHPWVDDFESEIKALKKQKEENIKNQQKAFGFIENNEPDDGDDE